MVIGLIDQVPITFEEGFSDQSAHPERMVPIFCTSCQNPVRLKKCPHLHPCPRIRQFKTQIDGKPKSKVYVELLSSNEFCLLAIIFLFQFDFGNQILQLGMQVTKHHLRLFYWFLECVKGHHNHKLLVDIHPSSPLEPNCLNQHQKFVCILSFELGNSPPLFWQTCTQGCHM